MRRWIGLLLCVGCAVDHGGVATDDVGTRDTSIDAPECAAFESCNGEDDDCDGLVDEGGLNEPCEGENRGLCEPGVRRCIEGRYQGACDGLVSARDEVCGNELDEDCDGIANTCGECTGPAACDTGRDGICSVGSAPCVEGVVGFCESVNRPQDEMCNGLDDDCDGTVDNGVLIPFFRDADGDGVGTDDDRVMACDPPEEYVAMGGDCDDENDARRPGLVEVCDGVDQDCSGDTEMMRTYYRDRDEDTRGDPGTSVVACAPPDGFVENAEDCDDFCRACFIDAEEVCDGFDNDCSGETDDGAMGGVCNCETIRDADHTYQFCRSATWISARNRCRADGYELASVNTRVEHDFLVAQMDAEGRFWIGLNDRDTEGTYVWSDPDETTTYRNFEPGEPDGGTDQNCIRMRVPPPANGRWTDRSCSDTYDFICEVPR